MSVKGRQGVDEAWQQLTPQEAKDAGLAFVVGYASEDEAKNLPPDLIDAYLAAGVGVLLVYEYSITAAEGGWANGARTAEIAVAHAKARRYPQRCALAFAVDEDETGHPSNISGYAQGFTATVHMGGWRSMVYGGLATVAYALDHQIVDLAWQTYAWSTVNGSLVWDPRVAIRQYRNQVRIAGKDVDLDVAMTDDIGAWWPDNQQGGLMSVTDDRIEAMFLGTETHENTIHRLLKQLRDGRDPNPGQGEPVDWYGMAQVESDLADLTKAVKALTVPASVLTDDDRTLIGRLTDALNAVAAHLK